MNYIIAIFNFAQDFENLMAELTLLNYRIQITILEVIPGKTTRKKDGMFQADGTSLTDGMATGSAIGGLFGAIYGSGRLDFPPLNPLFHLGPIANGLLGFCLGALIGYTLDRLLSRPKANQTPAQSLEEYGILITFTGRELFYDLQKLLYNHNAKTIVHTLKDQLK